MAACSRRGVADAHELGVAEDGRRAIAELEVEAAADGEHDVGLAHHAAPHRRHHGWMSVGHQALAFSGVQVGRAEGIEQRDELAPGAARAATADHQRPARSPQQFRRAGHGGRLRLRPRRRPGEEEFVALQGRRHRGAQRVGRKVEVHRSRLAAVAACPRHCLVELLQHQGRIAHGPRIARQRAHQVGMDDVLQRAAVLLRLRRHTGQHQHRRPGDMRVGNAGHRVGDAGPGRDQRHAETARHVAMRVSHVNRRALVTHVDDADAFGIEPHPDRHDVTAAQRKDRVDAARLQAARNDSCNRVAGQRRRGRGHAQSLVRRPLRRRAVRKAAGIEPAALA